MTIAWALSLYVRDFYSLSMQLRSESSNRGHIDFCSFFCFIREIYKSYYEKDGGAFGSTQAETLGGMGSIPMHLLTILGGCRKHVIESNESLPIIFLSRILHHI